ncbi:zf-TFIIB domain-containing protein [Streptomyces sp. 7-21]|jgi:Zn-finger nucleic acid-binding protein|uniref:TFIIB-type zinc ribbon-containing protein n=1 Tax=Streptomyces sp. 7-21 TaxID=2802283 RepID=UPI00191CC74C|nr:zf-TFIIB domain-containing protein [Streptomyces sp. 7-21]MBL1066061.1 zf-TFIIB domain-containing protein [Streptomyces sp. 7-21]
MQCPKCHAPMHTYNRSGVQIEQCSGCRGIFLDYGELEAITRLEAQFAAAPPPQAAPAPPPPSAPQGPAWGAPQQGYHGGYHHRRKGGLSGLFFSS